MKQDETLVMDGYKQLSKRIRKGKVVSGLFKCLTCGKTKRIYAEKWKNKK